jgi:hypothetical protein
MKRYLEIGMGIIAIIAIGTLSGFLIHTNSELGQTRGLLSSQQNTSTAAAAAAASTRERQYGLSTEAVSTLSAENNQIDQTRLAIASTNIGLINENTNLNNQFLNLQDAIFCSPPLTNVDFTNNATVSKALVGLPPIFRTLG